MESSDKVIIVTEPDPICVSASKNLEHEFRASLPRDTFWIVNGILLNEAREYRIIENYLTIFEHLPPIPFDLEVRKAFGHRGIRVDIDDPSPFLFGTSRMAKELLPGLKADLEELETGVKGKISHPIEEKIKEIDSDISHLRDSSYRQVRTRRMALFMLSVSFLYILLGAIIIGMSFLDTKLTRLSPESMGLLIMLMGLFGFLTTIFFYFFPYSRKVSLVSDRSEREIERLQAERDKYHTLLITKSDELLLEHGDREEHKSDTHRTG